MKLFYLNCLRRALIILSVLLAAAVIYVFYNLVICRQNIEAETFDLPEILSTEDNTRTKEFVRPLDTYKVIWTRQLRADLNPPKIETPKPSPKPPEPKLPALAGIIFEPQNSFALFASEGGRILLKKESQKIHEFTVSRILPGVVELVFKDKTYELKMPKNKAKEKKLAKSNES